VSGEALSFPHIFLFAGKRKMWSRRMARNGVRGADTPAARLESIKAKPYPRSMYLFGVLRFIWGT